MQRTPQQQEQIAKAVAAGEQRATVSFTTDQKRAWESAVQQELAGQQENTAHLRKMEAAASRAGFLGDVRRAIAVSRRPVEQLAIEIGIETRLLSDFRAGDAELPYPALDRLLDVLGLRLMQEIRR